MYYLISHTILLPMWGLQILLFGLGDSLVQRQSTKCKLCEDNVYKRNRIVHAMLINWFFLDWSLQLATLLNSHCYILPKLTD